MACHWTGLANPHGRAAGKGPNYPCKRRRLTPRSSRRATSGRTGRVAHAVILRHAAGTSCCRVRLTSNVRPAKMPEYQLPCYRLKFRHADIGISVSAPVISSSWRPSSVAEWLVPLPHLCRGRARSTTLHTGTRPRRGRLSISWLFALRAAVLRRAVSSS